MTTIPATKLKVNVSDILNKVYFKKESAIIERYGKPIAKIIPYHENEGPMASENIDDMLDSFFGILPDFPDVTKERSFRNRTSQI